MHWSLWGVSHLGLAKLVNCSQILGHVADQDYIEFTDYNVFALSISGWECCTIYISYLLVIMEMVDWMGKVFDIYKNRLMWGRIGVVHLLIPMYTIIIVPNY